MKKYFFSSFLIVALFLSGCGQPKAKAPAPAKEYPPTTVAPEPEEPPVTVLQWKEYKDEANGYTLSYPENFTIEQNKELIEETRNVGTSFVFPEEDLFKTISEARVNVVVQPATGCPNITDTGLAKKENDVTKNGVIYSAYSWQDAAAGNQYGGTIYQVFRNAKCYRISFFAHTTTPANYAGNEQEVIPLQEEHDATMSGLKMIFERIFSSFTLPGDAAAAPASSQFSQAPQKYTLGNNEFIFEQISAADFKSSFDKRVVWVKSDGTKEVVVPSMQKAIGARVFNDTLEEVSAPAGVNKVFFKEFLSETDGAPTLLWSFNGESKKFEPLVNCNKVYKGFGLQLLSPNGLFMAFADDDELKNITGSSRTLWLFDLRNDITKKITTLRQGNTFNAGYGSWSNKFDIAWIDNTSISYTMYNQNKAPLVSGKDFSGRPEDYKAVVAKKTVKIP